MRVGDDDVDDDGLAGVVAVLEGLRKLAADNDAIWT